MGGYFLPIRGWRRRTDEVDISRERPSVRLLGYEPRLTEIIKKHSASRLCTFFIHSFPTCTLYFTPTYPRVPSLSCNQYQVRESEVIWRVWRLSIIKLCQIIPHPTPTYPPGGWKGIEPANLTRWHPSHHGSNSYYNPETVAVSSL
jgi:hypothetical protein